MKLIKIIDSSNSKKKLDAYFELDNKKEKIISFGASSYRDYTLINNKSSKFYLPKKEDREKVKSAYIARHKKNENWNDPLTAGSLSRFVLWNKSSLNASIKDFKTRFNL